MVTTAHQNNIEALSQILAHQEMLEFAVLVGSRAEGTQHANSDWDIALCWKHQLTGLPRLAQEERLRQALSEALNVATENIDLIDLPRSNLAMRANAAEQGKVLKGEDTMAWARFLTRTWRELEDFYWERTHAA